MLGCHKLRRNLLEILQGEKRGIVIQNRNTNSLMTSSLSACTKLAVCAETYEVMPHLTLQTYAPSPQKQVYQKAKVEKDA